MESSDLQPAIDLFESHLHTIDLAIYLVGAVLIILSFITWKSIKSAIARQVSAEIKDLTETERDKIKLFIEKQIDKIATEEGTKLYQDISFINTPSKSKREL